MTHNFITTSKKNNKTTSLIKIDTDFELLQKKLKTKIKGQKKQKIYFNITILNLNRYRKLKIIEKHI